MELTITITDKSAEGFTFQASLDGKTVKDLVQETAEVKGISYWHDKQRAGLQDLMAKIEHKPEAYKIAIEAIAAQVAAEEGAAKPPVEEEPIVEGVK